MVRTKDDCNQRGIKIVGDIPIFVAEDSADVWTNPDQFKLDENGRPTVVAECHQIISVRQGSLETDLQLGSNEGRRFCLVDKTSPCGITMFDLVRIDHFRGFARRGNSAGDKTAERGRWWLSGKRTFSRHKVGPWRCTNYC